MKKEKLFCFNHILRQLGEEKNTSIVSSFLLTKSFCECFRLCDDRLSTEVEYW